MATYYRTAPFVKPREAIQAENRLSLGSTFRNIIFKGVQKAELDREWAETAVLHRDPTWPPKKLQSCYGPTVMSLVEE